MKKRNIILTAAAVVLVLTAAVPSAFAYFTTYVSAIGKKTVNLQDKTDIQEEIVVTTKNITITADQGSEPVFVRARAFWPEGYTVEYNKKVTGSKWTQNGDWWEYADPIADNGTGTYRKTTDPLTIDVTAYPATVKVGDTFNLVVVYESTPARYTEDAAGNKTPVKNWDEGVTHYEQSSSSDVTPADSANPDGGNTGTGEGTETGGGNG